MERKTSNNEPILGFWSMSDAFMIGEYLPKGGCKAEFKLEKTVFGFKAIISRKAFKLILDPRLEKLWNMTKNIETMRDMESYLINIGLVKIQFN